VRAVLQRARFEPRRRGQQHQQTNRRRGQQPSLAAREGRSSSLVRICQANLVSRGRRIAGSGLGRKSDSNTSSRRARPPRGINTLRWTAWKRPVRPEAQLLILQRVAPTPQALFR
jgi:hypothetical protein